MQHAVGQSRTNRSWLALVGSRAVWNQARHLLHVAGSSPAQVPERKAEGEAFGQKHRLAMEEKNTKEAEEKGPTRQMRGKILQFAGKMRANGLGGGLLNN
jgi:hypothetical protein